MPQMIHGNAVGDILLFIIQMETLSRYATNGAGQSHRFAALMFKHHVSFEQYSQWCTLMSLWRRGQVAPIC
ncbi:hypothetical protein FKM82_031041 [Ascaphus truei]